MQVADNCVVAIHYTLINTDGDTLDSSAGGEPLQYIQGTGGLIPGLERELEGKGAGDSFKVAIAPEDAYGSSQPELVQDVPLEALSQIENLEVGMQLQSQNPDGQVQNLVVDAIGEETVTLNANHPLADVELHFDVSVESVREASQEELDLGHVH